MEEAGGDPGRGYACFITKEELRKRGEKLLKDDSLAGPWPSRRRAAPWVRVGPADTTTAAATSRLTKCTASTMAGVASRRRRTTRSTSAGASLPNGETTS